MKTPLYRQALVHSWYLAKEHKMLLVFGLFAAMLGQMGIAEFIHKTLLAAKGQLVNPTWFDLPVFLGGSFFQGGAGFSLSASPWILWLILVLVGLAIVTTFVAVSSQGALVHAAAMSVKKKQLEDFSKAWHVGISHFWRVFFVHVFKKIGLLVTLFALSGMAVWHFTHPSAQSALLFILVFALAALVGIILSLLAVYAVGYIVVEEYSFTSALVEAWRLAMKHWLVSLEIGVVLLAMNMVLMLIVMLGLFVLFIPAMILWMLSAIVGSTLLLGFVTSISLLFTTLFIMWIGAFFTVFATTAWTYLFMRMHKKGIKSRLLHWLGRKK